jgi:hypothetical protein
MESTHFTFEALAAIRAALRRHDQQYGATPGWWSPDDISVVEFHLGTGYRDHNPIAHARKV